jgi:DNA-binding NarL/FixJ family response regulator
MFGRRNLRGNARKVSLSAEARFTIVGRAQNVADALSLLDQNGCDAALLDINLGHETSEPVALELAKRKTPFVTLSAYSLAQRETRSTAPRPSPSRLTRNFS